MKYLFLTAFLLLSCGDFGEQTPESKYKQVYYDCYYVSQEFFKKISPIDYQDLRVEEMCNQDTSFLDNPGDEVCMKACVDAFNHYK